MNEAASYDVFISYAWEDKERLVHPLACALSDFGLHVWYTDFSLRVGDSLIDSIDKAIAHCQKGLVIISPYSLCKAWPEYELRGLLTRQIQERRKIILPVWHGVTSQEVRQHSHTLADMMALRTDGVSAPELAIRLLLEIRPDLYLNYPREYWEKVARGEAFAEMQKALEQAYEQLQQVKDDLAQYRCPFCASPLTGRESAPTDPDGRDWDEVEIFACGYHTFGGRIEHPCPSDPNFPRFDDFELHWRSVESSASGRIQWDCTAKPKNERAHKLTLRNGVGDTKEEAEQNLREIYEWHARKWKKA